MDQVYPLIFLNKDQIYRISITNFACSNCGWFEKNNDNSFTVV